MPALVACTQRNAGAVVAKSAGARQSPSRLTSAEASSADQRSWSIEVSAGLVPPWSDG